MKIGEALAELKKEQSRLARMIMLRKEHIYEEKNKPLKFDPQKLTTEINRKCDDVRKLKISIQQTNLATTLPEEKITVAEAIIKINDIRNEIKHLSSLFERRSSYLFKEKDEKEVRATIDEKEVEREIEKLENEKTRLDNKIQMTNWSTTVV